MGQQRIRQLQRQAATPMAAPPAQKPFSWQRPFPVPAPDTATAAPQPIPDLQARLEILRRANPDWSKVKFSTPPAKAVQAKLTVGAPNDQYEQEADRVADQVMRMPDAATQPPVQREGKHEEDELQTKPVAATITPLVQREAMPEEEDPVQKKASGNADIQREEIPEEEEVLTKPLSSGTLQREEMPEEHEELQMKSLGAADLQREEMPEEHEELQMKSLGTADLQREALPGEDSLQPKSSPTPHTPHPTPSLETQLSNSQGSGSPLPNDVRSFMEPRFGADFSQVRVHTGSEAVQMNRDLNAQAFTHKQEVYFGAGKAPAKDALTAHELSHVIQQAGVAQVEHISNAIQRDNIGAGGAPAESPYRQTGQLTGDTSRTSDIQGGVKGKIKLDEFPMGEKTFGPLLGKLSVETELEFEEVQGNVPNSSSENTPRTTVRIGNKNQPPQIGPGGQDKARVGSVGDTTKGEVGLSGEVQHDFEQGFRSKMLNWQPSIKGAGELTPKSGKFGVQVFVDTAYKSIPIKIVPIEFNIIKWDAKDKKPQFAVCTTSGEMQLLEIQHKAIDGKIYRLRVRPKLKFEFRPDPVKIGQWVVDRMATVVATEVGLASAIIGAGVMTIGVGLYQIATSGEITERTEFAVQKCKNYCQSFINVLRGEPPIDAPGGAEGSTAGSQYLAQLTQKYPPEIVKEEAKKQELYRTTWKEAWPKIKEQAIKDYWNNHGFEAFVTGGEGLGNGGFKTFKRVLDSVG